MLPRSRRPGRRRWLGSRDAAAMWLISGGQGGGKRAAGFGGRHAFRSTGAAMRVDVPAIASATPAAMSATRPANPSPVNLGPAESGAGGRFAAALAHSSAKSETSGAEPASAARTRTGVNANLKANAEDGQRADAGPVANSGAAAAAMSAAGTSKGTSGTPLRLAVKSGREAGVRAGSSGDGGGQQASAVNSKPSDPTQVDSGVMNLVAGLVLPVAVTPEMFVDATRVVASPDLAVSGVSAKVTSANQISPNQISQNQISPNQVPVGQISRSQLAAGQVTGGTAAQATTADAGSPTRTDGNAIAAEVSSFAPELIRAGALRVLQPAGANVNPSPEDETLANTVIVAGNLTADLLRAAPEQYDGGTSAKPRMHEARLAAGPENGAPAAPIASSAGSQKSVAGSERFPAAQLPEDGPGSAGNLAAPDPVVSDLTVGNDPAVTAVERNSVFAGGADGSLGGSAALSAATDDAPHLPSKPASSVTVFALAMEGGRADVKAVAGAQTEMPATSAEAGDARPTIDSRSVPTAVLASAVEIGFRATAAKAGSRAAVESGVVRGGGIQQTLPNRGLQTDATRNGMAAGHAPLTPASDKGDLAAPPGDAGPGADSALEAAFPRAARPDLPQTAYGAASPEVVSAQPNASGAIAVSPLAQDKNGRDAGFAADMGLTSTAVSVGRTVPGSSASPVAASGSAHDAGNATTAGPALATPASGPALPLAAAGGKPSPTPDLPPDLPPAHQMLDAAPVAAAGDPSAGMQAGDAGVLRLHLGIHTTAFGNVEIHTVVEQSQVGVAIRGDHNLTRWFTSEVGSLEAGLKNQHLSLAAVDFTGARSGAQTAGGFQQGQPRQNFSQARGAASVAPVISPPSEAANEVPAALYTPSESRVSILV